MRRFLLLRPEPGLSASAARARDLGLDVITCPLFRIEAVPWNVPDPAEFSGLLLSSANAVRFGGPGLAGLMGLPVHAVGEATAAAARDAGFHVATVGNGDFEQLLAALADTAGLLHLAGEDHRDVGRESIERLILYRSVAIADPGLPVLSGLVAAVHSPRAGSRFAELVDERSDTVIAAISDAAAAACGRGWNAIEVAERPSDKSLLALAARLCQTPVQQ